MSRPSCPNCHTPQAWEMWRHCHCGYDFGLPIGIVGRAKCVEKPASDDRNCDGAIIGKPLPPKKLQASICLKLVVTWSIICTLLWLGWIFPEPLRIHWYNISVGTLVWILPRLRRNVPRYRGGRMSVTVRTWVALVAVVLLACCFVVPMAVQPYLVTVLIVPGAIAAIYSEARLFWNPLRYLPSPPPGE